MKEIVILGGGFAGIATAMALKKHQTEEIFHITLIDKNNYHLFTPSLYEVATSEEPQGNIAIPNQRRVSVLPNLVCANRPIQADARWW